MFVPDSLQGREPVPAGLLHSPSIKHGRPQATKETENKESCRISSKNYVRKYYKFSFRFQKRSKIEISSVYKQEYRSNVLHAQLIWCLAVKALKSSKIRTFN